MTFPADPTKILLSGSDRAFKESILKFLRGFEYDSATDTFNITAANLTVNGVSVAAQAFYGFSAYLSADQLNITGIDKIDWNATLHDTTGGDYASGTFTPSIAGYYGFSTAVKWINISSADDRYLYFYKAGAIYRATLIDFFVGSHPPLSGVVYANGTTDTFAVYAQDLAFDTADIDASISVAGDASWFDMYLIRSA